MNWRGGWWLDSAPKSLVAQSIGGGPKGTAGKYYFEFTITHTYASGFNAAFVGFGIADTNASLTNFGAWDNNSSQSVEAHGCGNCFNSLGAGQGLGYSTKPSNPTPYNVAAPAPPHVFAVAVDTVNHKIWFKDLTSASIWVGDGTPSEDPNTGVGGFDWSTVITGDVYAWAGADEFNDTNYGAGTINFGGSAFTGTLPTGYSAWGASDFLNPNDNGGLVLSGGNLSISSLGNSAWGSTGHLVRSYGRITRG